MMGEEENNLNQILKDLLDKGRFKKKGFVRETSPLRGGFKDF